MFDTYIFIPRTFQTIWNSISSESLRSIFIINIRSYLCCCVHIILFIFFVNWCGKYDSAYGRTSAHFYWQCFNNFMGYRHRTSAQIVLQRRYSINIMIIIRFVIVFTIQCDSMQNSLSDSIQLAEAKRNAHSTDQNLSYTLCSTGNSIETKLQRFCQRSHDFVCYRFCLFYFGCVWIWWLTTL